jgi:aminoglycoside 3-N-acetyltransferase I
MPHACTGDYRVVRLGTGDRATAQAAFTMMAEVFEEERALLGDAYLDALLAREETWIFVAWCGEAIVGAITAHVLPMTREEIREVFIYDLAVRVDHQRRSIGRLLVSAVRALASEQGLGDVFVPADEADDHALAFYRAVGGDESKVRFFTFAPLPRRGTAPRG